MRVVLKEEKLYLTEIPKNNVPGALIVFDKKMESYFIDVEFGKRNYRLPNGMTKHDIASVYLRII